MKRSSWFLGLSVIALTIASATGPAAAVVLVEIPVDTVIYGDPGDELFSTSRDIPSELVGSTCEMSGYTDNLQSVHLGNDLIIRIGDRTTVVENFEDESFVHHEFSSIEELPEVIEVFVRLGPDGVSSGGFVISIECPEPPATTTTTTTSTTTTAAPTTTAVASPTTQVEAPSTTTTVIAGPTTEPSVPSTTLAAAQPPVLAVTGSGPQALALVGLALLAVGAFLVVGVPRLRRPSA